MDISRRIALSTISIDMRFSPADMEGALHLLRSVVGLTLAKPGCRACSVLRDTVEEERVRYREEWESDSTFRRHVRSGEFRRVLMAMDMACEEPQVLVGSLTGISGMESLRELRREEGEITA